jgi:hypothetical protein
LYGWSLDGEKHTVRTRILLVILIFTLAASLQAQVAERAPEITLNASELVFPGVINKTTIPSQVIQIKNIGTTNLQITNITKTGSADFTLSGLPTFPHQLAPNGTLDVQVEFKPTTTLDHGKIITGAVTITNNDSNEGTLNVNLYGLSAEGLEGANEPGLKNVLETLGHKIDPGWNGLLCGQNGADNCDKPAGEEVLVPLFRKAGTGAVTIKVVGRYSPDLDIPFGWYTPNGSTPIRHQVAVISEGISVSLQYPPNYQTLNPVIDAGGGTTFNPGTAVFGIYVLGLQDRYTYTEDALNADGPTLHAVRVYPLRNRAGALVPNSYLLGFEDASNGDYQDYMFVLSNVVDANAPLPTNTPTRTPTHTPLPPTSTHTPTDAPTDTPPTSEPTQGPSETATDAPVESATPDGSATNMPGESATPDSPTAEASATVEPTATGPTETPTLTLTPSSTPDLSTGVELLTNGGFEVDTDSNTEPDSWAIKNGSKDRMKCNKDKDGDGVADKIVAHEGMCAFMFRSGEGENALIKQSVDPAAWSFAAGDTLALGAYVKAKEGVSAVLKLNVKYVDTTLPKSKIKAAIAASESYMPMLELVGINGVPAAIKVRVHHFSVTGKLWVDAASLLWVPADSAFGIIPLPVSP